MAKIDLNTVSSGYLSQAALNANFTAIEDEFQNKVLYRDNPSGEPNSMQTHLDMNGYHVLNAGNLSASYGNIQYDTFAGTGSQTQFTLTADPGTIGNLVVSVDGLVQVPVTDYLLGSSKVIFVTAPPNGSEILARYGVALAQPIYYESLVIACSDEATALTAGTAKVTFRMPYAMALSSVRASLTTAQTSGSILTVDINEGGTSILSTKLTVDNTEKTSLTAATPTVISDSSLANDAEITIDIDQVGDGTAKGLKVMLLGSRA